VFDSRVENKSRSALVSTSVNHTKRTGAQASRPISSSSRALRILSQTHIAPALAFPQSIRYLHTSFDPSHPRASLTRSAIKPDPSDSLLCSVLVAEHYLGTGCARLITTGTKYTSIQCNAENSTILQYFGKECEIGQYADATPSGPRRAQAGGSWRRRSAI
jgi:hypothetical protein